MMRLGKKYKNTKVTKFVLCFWINTPAVIDFWDGAKQSYSSGPRCIDVQLPSPQIINSNTLAAVDASGNNGLSEVEIWVGEKSSGSSCSNTASMP